MDVKLTQTGETITVNKSYGMRLIEQGMAVPVTGHTRKSDAKAAKGEA